MIQESSFRYKLFYSFNWPFLGIYFDGPWVLIPMCLLKFMWQLRKLPYSKWDTLFSITRFLVMNKTETFSDLHVTGIFSYTELQSFFFSSCKATYLMVHSLDGNWSFITCSIDMIVGTCDRENLANISCFLC